MAAIALAAAASAATPSLIGGLGLTATSLGGMLVTGLVDTAAGVAGSFIDNALFGSGPARIKGPRLSELTVQTSTYGKMIPVIYGSARIAGNVIWSRDIKEVATNTSSGGGKGGAPSVTTTSFSYYATLAIAICEGPIDEIVRVWADTKVIDPHQSSSTYNIYYGDETQLPDPIIESFKGVGNVSAHRGIAYVVVEDFPLADFGNRIPNFTFEVRKKLVASTVTDEDPVEDIIKSMVIIPGSGEFVYDTVVQTKIPGSSVGSGFAQQGKAGKINQHNVSNKADSLVALDQLENTCPNLEWVSLVVSWFGDSLDAGSCNIYPAVEYNDGSTTQPDIWSVAGITRDTATRITLDVNGNPIYGGTPSDDSVVRYVQELKSRGYNVAFYPLMFMDMADKPWRGRITGTASEVSDIFTRTDGYNDFIMHYANLVGGDVDAFIIGSELVGLTKVQDTSDDSFPAVDELVSLAATVKGIVGSSVKVTYAADWSEYHHTDGGWYNLDPLWASSNIDMVGIDAYFPLTDEPQTGYDVQKIIDGWTSGEGYDWIYTDPGRTTQSSLTPQFAWKNIQWWWENSHVNPDASTTAWTPMSKKIWFTEVGYPSVDGAANQPNVFYDPNSSESSFPYHSKGRVDLRAQRQALTGTMLKWKDSTMVERMFVWTWDARPFSFWPDLTNVWSDGGLWRYGHWAQGKLGLSGLAAIVEDLCRRSGLADGDFDITRLTQLVEGFVLTDRNDARGAIANLQLAYFFDGVESDGLVKFVPRGDQSVISVDENELVPGGEKGARQLLNITRAHELDLPQKVDVNYISKLADYQMGNQHSQRQVANTKDMDTLNLSVVLSDQEAKNVADITLFNKWVGRTQYDFSLPLKYAHLEPTDVVEITVNGATHVIRITSSHFGKPGILQLQGSAEDVTVYDFFNPAGGTGGGLGTVEDGGLTDMDILDLPVLPSNLSGDGEIHFAVTGLEKGWLGTSINRSDDAGATYFPIITITDEAVKGSTEDVLGSVTATNVFDRTNSVTVILLEGELESTSDLAVLNGANAALLGNEIIQFATATLVEPNKYVLSDLLRGRLGTEDEVGNHAAGDRFVLIKSLPKMAMPNALLNLTRQYKPVTFGQTLADTIAEYFTYTGNVLKPYSPVNITGTRDGSGNLTINWVRRTRIGGDWTDHVDTQLGEQTEAYEVDILNGSTVVRTITGLTTPAATYSAANQTTDFGSPQSSVSVKIYQMSAAVGRGKAGVATV